MTTILILRDSKRKMISRCNEKCYDAKTVDCDCICKGRNHGVGLKKAIANLEDFVCGFQIPYLPAGHERQTVLSHGPDFPAARQRLLFPKDNYGV